MQLLVQVQLSIDGLDSRILKRCFERRLESFVIYLLENCGCRITVRIPVRTSLATRRVRSIASRQNFFTYFESGRQLLRKSCPFLVPWLRVKYRYYPTSQRSEELWMFSAASVCFFVNTITSEGVDIGCWNLGVGALYENLGRVWIWGHAPWVRTPRMWRWATTLGKSAQAV